MAIASLPLAPPPATQAAAPPGAKAAAPTTTPTDSGENQFRAPGSPAKTPLNEPTGDPDEYQFFYLHEPNFFSLLTNGNWPPRVKFQFSLRFEMIRINGDRNNFGVSVAYTQKSFWDLFDWNNSSPFVENDYKPELFFTYRPERRAFYREVQAGIQHESNGLGNIGGFDETPNSRSWSYLFAQVRWGLGRDDPANDWLFFTPGLRGWYPIEKSSDELVKTLGYAAILLDIEARVPNHPRAGRLDLLFKLQRHSFQGDLFYPLTAPTTRHFRVAVFLQAFKGQGERLLETAAPAMPAMPGPPPVPAFPAVVAPDVFHFYAGLGFE